MTSAKASLADLTPQQRRRLVERLRARGGTGTTPAAVGSQVRPRDRADDQVVLSSAQERMWFLEQFQPGSAMHVMSGAVRLPAVVPPQVFAECLDEVVARHEVLRTRFEVRAGVPVGVVEANLQVPFRYLDGVDETTMWAAFEADATVPFRVAEEPLLRATLATTDDGRCYVQVAMHHLVSDGFSTGILFSELGALCVARLLGQRADLPPVPFQYADYAQWLAQTGASAQTAAAVEYWRGALADAPQVLALPEDRPRPDRFTYRGDRLAFELDASLSGQVRAYAAAQGTTPFAVFLAAYAVVLSRWAADDTVVVGAPSAQRSEVGADQVVGPFLNTLALCVSLQGAPSLREAVARAGQVTRAGFAHQSLPFERVLRELKVARDPSRSPLVQAVLNVQHAPPGGLELRDLHNGCAQFDLLVALTLTSGTTTGHVDYASDVFDRRTVAAMVAAFRRVLETVVDDDAVTVDRVPLTPSDSPDPPASSCPTRPTAVVRPAAPTLHDAVLSTAGRWPDRRAVTQGSEDLSFGDLAERVSALAARLRAVDPGSRTPVGLVLPRSVDTVVAMVASSLAGRPFVPLDPDYPAERLAMICQDAGVDVVVTSSQHRGAVPPAVPVVVLTDVGATAVPAVGPPETVGPSDCAYILYTSGSTGRPKGVRVSHANLVSLLDAMAQEPGLSADDVLLAVTSPSFDIALLELLLPLVVGASLVVAMPADVVDGARLGGLLDAHQVTVMQATPVTWRLLLDAGWAGRPALRALCGGEAMPVPLARRLVPCVAELWNMYGPTETTIWSSVHRVGTDDLDRQVIPLGHPIAGTGLMVVDPGLRPVPVGVYGELCIVGAGVTLGYHERPELTAERFVDLPLPGSPRAYRTGDLVRRRLDGRIEFGGRMDRQVKVRGFRIELGEVETAAATASGLPCVADVDASGQSLLVFMESAPAAAPDPGALRQQMALRLPPQMLPQRFVAVEQFPHTPNGKIDRAALRRLGLVTSALVAPETGGGRAAESDLEKVLADIWQDLLGLDQPPGVEEDFFLLGGHSLLATKLVFRVRDAVGVEVPLPVLFSGHLTIEHLVREIASAQDAPVQRIRPRHRDGGQVPLSSSQERMWFLEQFQPGLAMHVMSGAVRLPAVVPPQVFAECLDQVVARHESLRTRVEVRDGEPVGIVDPAVQVPFRYLEGVTEADMWATFEADATVPFRVATDPLVRATLASTDDGRCYVQITMHHLVADGHSTGILFSELGRLCAARLLGQTAELPPVPFQYADYAQWLAETDDPRTAAAVEYWRTALADAPQALTLPEDRPRPERFTYRGGRLALELDAELSGRVRAYASAQGTTPFAVFLGAWAVVLSRWTADDTVVVGTPTAQRFEIGTDQVVGPFLNTLALCVSLDDAPSLREAVARCGQVAREGLVHQSLPFERVLSEVQVARDPSRSPLVQAMLNVQQSHSGDLELRDLSNGCVQFDLLLNLVTTSGATTGHVDFASDVYDERTVRAIVEAFRRVLQTMVDDDTVAVDRVPLTARADRDPSAGAVAPQEPVVPPEVALSAPTLHAAVLAAVARWPERPAVTEDTQSLSFGQVAQRAARLADRICAASEGHGAAVVGATATRGGAPVGLVLPRSVDTVVAMVASSLAGRPFVPLDPDYPAERLAMICQDAGVDVVVTSSQHRDAVPPCGAAVVLTDVDEGPADVGPAGRRVVASSDCAYILYTSGSTGRPKGVRVSHANLVSLLDAMAQEPGLSADDVLLAVTSPSFDIALLELLLPLVVGASLVVAAPGDVVDPVRLAGLLDAHEVTVMQATPVTWQLLLDAGWAGRPSLRAWCGGEAMPVPLAEGLVPRVAELWNMYGPTETTIWSSVHRVDSTDLDRQVIPLGHPIAGTGLVVVDPALRPVPVGVYGELCIVGAGVTLGYHERPELTAERFVDLPLPGSPRAYRTGDLVRRRLDGRIEFGGRMDRQVKVRGFRIELGEVETAAATASGLPCVADVDASGQSLLVFVEAAPHDVPDPAVLHAQMALRLPPQMLPQRFVAVEQFPHTPNGKIDRAALRRLGPTGTALLPAPGGGSRAAESDLEKLLADIWQDLLGLDQPPGAEEDFFLLGGHSLLATKLVFRVRDAVGVEVPLPVLFGGDLTVAHLAEVLERGPGALDEPTIDLEAEVDLDPAIRPPAAAPVRSATSPRHLLVTGATGFVGSFLLGRLLETTEAVVSCLVRADTPTAALERIRQTMTGYGIWREEYTARVRPVLGTLDQPRLGLAPQQWQELAREVDVIFHSGATVNFLRSYESLKAANVTGTQEVLRLATDTTVKPVQYVSSLSVFSPFAYPVGTVFGEQAPDPVPDPESMFGYVQTKWVAEQLVLQARRRGVPANVFRTGHVTGHSQTGACQQYDFIWQAVRLGIRMGIAPVIPMKLDLTPVDYVVAAIAYLGQRQIGTGRTYHVVAPEPLPEPDFVAWMESYGYRGEKMSFARWSESVVDRAINLDDDAASALAPFLSGVLPLDQMPVVEYDASAVREDLEGSGIECPPIDETLLRRYCDWFVATGYFDPPGQRAELLVAAEGDLV